MLAVSVEDPDTESETDSDVEPVLVRSVLGVNEVESSSLLDTELLNVREAERSSLSEWVIDSVTEELCDRDRVME